MRIRFLSVLLLASSALLSAQVTLPKILSSHMVMQRDLPVHIWGMAAPGQSVTTAFRGESRTVPSDPLGHWNAYMKPGSAGGPFTLTVTPGAASNTSASQPPITLDDIMVGDVWVASGQSNMEFPLSRASTAAQDLPNAANPQIRLLMIRKRTADYAMGDADTDGWTLRIPKPLRSSQPLHGTSPATSPHVSTSPSASSTPPGAAQSANPGSASQPSEKTPPSRPSSSLAAK